MPNRTIRTAVAGVAALAALTACGVTTPWEGTQLDEWGWYACDDYGLQLSSAGGADAAAALSEDAREGFVSEIAQSAGNSETRDIESSFIVLTRTTDGPEATWQLGLDTFANACMSNGWDPR